MLKEFQLAQSRAREESEQRYPTEWAPPDQVKKRIEFQDQIMEKYEGDLAEQFGLTPEQLGAIVVEGLQKDWPYPE